jgi:hypothetical protein
MDINRLTSALADLIAKPKVEVGNGQNAPQSATTLRLVSGGARVIDRRRARRRTIPESRATRLTQTIRQDSWTAARNLEAGLRAGGDPTVTFALLAAAQTLAAARGLDLELAIAAIRSHLERKGFRDLESLVAHPSSDVM